MEGRGVAQMGRPCPLYSWSINPIHFKVKTSKNERFLSSSFGMANICILEWSFMADFSTIWMICKILMCAISKLLDENCSFFDRLPLKCIWLIDQMGSGRGQPIWATPYPPVGSFTVKNRATGLTFEPDCTSMWIWMYSDENVCILYYKHVMEFFVKWKWNRFIFLFLSLSATMVVAIL